MVSSLFNPSLPSLEGISLPSLVPATPPFSVEGSLWPLLRVKLGRNATAAEFETYLEVRDQWLERCEPHVCILDVRDVHLPPTQLRLRYTAWLIEREAEMRRWSLGNVYVIQSPEVRMMMSLMRHSAHLAMPFVVTDTLPPGAAWAAARLQEAGLAQAATRVRAAHGIAAS